MQGTIQRAGGRAMNGAPSQGSHDVNSGGEAGIKRAFHNQTLPGQAMRSLCPGRRAASMCGALTPSHYPQTPAWVSRTQKPPPQSGPGFCSIRSPPLKTERAAGPHLPATTHYGPTSRPCHHEGEGRGGPEQGCPHLGWGSAGP